MRYHHKSINIYLCYSICSFSSLSFFFRSLYVMQSKPLLLSTMITMTSSKCTDYLKRMMAIRDIIQWHGGCTSLNITVWCNGAIIVKTFISRTEMHKCTLIIKRYFIFDYLSKYYSNYEMIDLTAASWLFFLLDKIYLNNIFVSLKTIFCL